MNTYEFKNICLYWDFNINVLIAIYNNFFF